MGSSHCSSSSSSGPHSSTRTSDQHSVLHPPRPPRCFGAVALEGKPPSLLPPSRARCCPMHPLTPKHSQGARSDWGGCARVCQAHSERCSVAVPAGLALSRKAAGAGRVRTSWPGTGCMARSSAHRRDAGLAAQGGSVSPPQGHVKTSLPLPRAQCLQEMAGFVFFFLLFFLNSSQKSIKISPQKTPCWSARSGTKKCKTVSQKPFKSCKKAGGVGAAGAAGTEPCPPPHPSHQPSGMGLGPGPGLARGALGWLLSAQSHLSHTAQRRWRKAAAGCAAFGSHTKECSPVGRVQSRPLREAGGLEGSLQPSAEQGGAGMSLMGQLPPAAPGAGPVLHWSPAKGPLGWCWRLGKAVPTPTRAPRGWTHGGSRRARGAHPSARGQDGSCGVGG